MTFKKIVIITYTIKLIKEIKMTFKITISTFIASFKKQAICQQFLEKPPLF